MENEAARRSLTEKHGDAVADVAKSVALINQASSALQGGVDANQAVTKAVFERVEEIRKHLV